MPNYQKHQVALIALGPQHPLLSLKKIRRVLNSTGLFRIELEEIDQIDTQNGIVTDEYIFEAKWPGVAPDNEFLFFVVANPLDGNWFVRSNISRRLSGIHSDSLDAIVATTYETDEIAESILYPLENAIAQNLVVSFISWHLQKGGVEYNDIFIDNPSNSAFGFCSSKIDFVYSLRNPTLGTNVEQLLEEIGTPKKTIGAFKRALKKTDIGPIDKLRRAFQRKPMEGALIISIIVSLVFFSLGAFVAG